MSKKTYIIEQEMKKLREMIEDANNRLISLQKEIDNTKNDWGRVKHGKDYYFITGDGSICEMLENGDKVDDRRYEYSNYFKTKDKAIEVNEKQMLIRKLQKYADENNEQDIDWSYMSNKYYIIYNHNRNRVEINSCSFLRELGQVYFSSKEVAERALELYRADIERYFGIRIGE